ncbi:MAG: hypothetical protein QHC79_17955 [Pseudosphingobacterium sp.]|uniref:hypothetical protein n=1 Tax=Olivibacter sp. LS-1 TaxID=2592345 RepID=UPI0011EAA4E1|nr:hypothetical protein [Olivibacter sp. LS-1]MDX3915434.1 hypothetical protein [Pseudosphingobacterium sp.]QEL02921.1 hypothetical protein FKG96_19555 [Olivibacter sp. LS-1]
MIRNITLCQLIAIMVLLFFTKCTVDWGEWSPAGEPVAVKNMLGINAFEWDFLQDPNVPHKIDSIQERQMHLIKSFSSVRHYLDWDKLEHAEGSFTFNPTYSGGWNLDLVYERCKQDSLTTLVCIKNVPDWLFNTYPEGERDPENIPAPYSSDLEDASSYHLMGRVAFQFAARYGSNKDLDSSLVRVDKRPRWKDDSVNRVKIGLNLVKYIECNNEPDKWWKGKKAQQNGRQYAANMSAFYDGHKGKLGKDVGVKNADPNMVVVMGGLAKGDINFVKDMVAWCVENRGYKTDGSVDLCFDVLNYHIYSNDNLSWFSKVYKSKRRGIAPERSDMGDVADEWVAYGKNLKPGLPVWVSETGYDLRQTSTQRAIPIGNKDVLQTQADWLLRTALLYAKHAVQKVFFYQLFDFDAEGQNSGTPYGRCGLVNRDSRRPAANYFIQVNRLMGNYRFITSLSKDPVVDQYSYQGNDIYVAFVPDEENRKERYTLSLPGAKQVVLYEPDRSGTTMRKKAKKLVGETLELEVGETPLFIQPVK